MAKEDLPPPPKQRMTPPTDAADVCRSLVELGEILDDHYSLREEMMQKIARWFGSALMVIALLGMLMAVIMFMLIRQIDQNMTTISHEMVGMRQHVQELSLNVTVMTQTMRPIADNMEVMNRNFQFITEDMDNITLHLASIDNSVTDIPNMREDMIAMTQTMQWMRHDMTLMRHNVHHLERNTSTMMAPFRMMSVMMP